MKQYYIMFGVGKVKYLLNFHDGESKHPDGSPFWGVQCFSNKKKLTSRVKQMEAAGYTAKR